MKKHLNIKRTADKVEIWISDEFYKFFCNKRYYIHDNIIKSYNNITLLEVKLRLKSFDIPRVLVGNQFNGNLTLRSPKPYYSECTDWFKSAEYNLKYPATEDFYKNTSIILAKMFEYFREVKLREKEREQFVNMDHLFDYLEIENSRGYDMGESLY